MIPTLDAVHGLAIHGPTATLFTLGRDHTVQQFDLNPPALVANKHHPPPIPPPSPPVSVESRKNQGVEAAPNVAAVITASTPATTVAIKAPVTIGVSHASESEEEALSPLQKIANEMDMIEQRRQSRVGTRSRTSSSASLSQAPSVSSKSSAASRKHRSHRSVSSKVTSNEGTTFSYGSSIRSPVGSASTGTWVSSSSVTSSRSLPRGSRLKQEVLRSPDDMPDLFPHIRARLDDVPYLNPHHQDKSQLTPADLRRQMLSVVFGWEDDIDSLIQDQLQRHPANSASAVLLSKWLGDVDPEIMASMVGSETMTSSDWMLLALSGFGGQASTKKVGQAYVQRLLEKRDVHAAATILLGLGDQNDAVEIYVSHMLYMEAILLTSLIFRNDWQRLSSLVRRWGENAVQHSQQHLAIRCFSCTGCETSAVLTSPRAYDSSNVAQPFQYSLLSPPLSPPSTRNSRITAKNSALKLITDFKSTASSQSLDLSSKLLSAGSEDRTPMNGAGVTPIADSAISPGMTSPHPSAFTRGRNPESARTATPGGVSRRRLPSIGEHAFDDTPRANAKPNPLPTPVDSGSDTGKEKMDGQPAAGPGPTLSPTKYKPDGEARSPMSQVSSAVLPSPAQNAFTLLKADARTRNGSRDRKPDGLQIQWPPMESIITGDYMSPASAKPRDRLSLHSRSNTEPSLYTPASQGLASSLGTGNSLNSGRSPLQTGRSIDNYISSLDEANFHAKKARGESRRRQESRDGRSRRGSDADHKARGRSQSRHGKAREASEDRGRAGVRYIKPAKRSPSSPVPMSPDDFPYQAVSGRDDESYYAVSSPNEEIKRSKGSRVRGSSQAHTRTESVGSRSRRRRSPDRQNGSRANSRPAIRGASRTTSRQHSPASAVDRPRRGRSSTRPDGPLSRSPSSPLPMSPQAKLYQDEDEEELRAVEEDRQRFRSRQRSTSRRPHEGGTSAMRHASPDRRHLPPRSRSRQPREANRSNRKDSRDPSPATRLQTARTKMKDNADSSGDQSERALKKEMAARELEERRKSLARRPSAPAIPSPGEISAGLSSVSSRPPDYFDSPTTDRSPVLERPERVPPRSKTTSPDGSQVSMGLPATPRAMRHPRYMTTDMDEIPAIPEIPNNLSGLTQAQAVTSVEGTEELAPLPNTVYAAASRPTRRSSSAPILEELASPPPFPAALPTHPAFQYGVAPSTRRRGTPAGSESGRASAPRKVAPGDAQPGTLGFDARNNSPVYVNSPPPIMVSIDETIQESNESSAEEKHKSKAPPPPPPPNYPVVPELQHLAQPPPPPPPPPAPPGTKPCHSSSNSVSTTAGTDSGVINIGIEDNSRGATPIIEVPPPSRSAQGHSRKGSLAESINRGRSTADSFTSRFNRATQRMRSKSGSRSRANKSPPVEVHRGASPYESILAPSMQTDVPVRSQTTSPNMERHPKEVRANMAPEAIRTGLLEGGMI